MEGGKTLTEGKAASTSANDKAHTWRSRLNSWKRTNSTNPQAQPPNQPLTKTTPAPTACPECGSAKIWRGGFWHPVSNGMPIQRWQCRDCGYRFSKTFNNAAVNAHFQHNGDTPLSFSHGSEHSERLQKLHRLILKSRADKPVSCRVSASDNGAKNLVEVETRIQEKAAGATAKTSEDMKSKIVEYTWWLKKEGYSETTILGRSRLLKILLKRGANLYDPESIKDVIAKQNWSVGRKANAVDAYSSFLEMAGGQWKPPRYTRMDKMPFIPTETEVDQLIAGCSKRMGTFLQLLKETGIRSGEAWRLTWNEVDTVSKVVRITPEKNSNPRIFHISPKLAAMFEALPRNYGDRVFSMPQQPLDHHRDNFNQQRKRLACKLKNQRLKQLTFHTLRHWKGTMEYHRTRDPFHVMSILGHKNIKNTLKYIHLAEELFKDQQDYVSKVAKTEADACILIEAGFEYVCDFNGAKLFRKPKY